MTGGAPKEKRAAGFLLMHRETIVIGVIPALLSAQEWSDDGRS